MHLGDGLVVKVVVGAVVGAVHQLHDVGHEGGVVRIGLEARSEDGDEVFAGSDLAVGEDALDGGLGLHVVLDLGVILGAGTGDGLGDGVIHGDDVVSLELSFAVEVDGRLEVVHEQAALRLAAQLLDDRRQVVIQILGVVAAEIDHILTLVVQDGGLLVHALGGTRIELQTLVLEGEKAVHLRLEQGGILPVLIDFAVQQGGTMDEQVLGSGSRADGIRFPPVRKGGIIVFLLVVLLVVGEVLDAFCTVCTILSLGRCVLAHEGCHGGQEDEGQLFHIALEFVIKLLVLRFPEPDVEDVESDVESKVFLFDKGGSETPLSEVQCKGDAIVSLVHRKRHAEGDAGRGQILPVHLVIGLVHVGSEPVGAALQIVADVVPVGGEFEARPERLSLGCIKGIGTVVAETADSVEVAAGPVAAEVIELHRPFVTLGIGETHAELVAQGDVIIVQGMRTEVHFRDVAVFDGVTGHLRLEAVGGAEGHLARADGLLILKAELGRMGPDLQGVAEGLAAVAGVAEGTGGVLADGTEIQVILRADGKAVPQEGGSPEEELVKTAVTGRAIGTVAGITDALLARSDRVQVRHRETRVAERLDAHHERGLAPHREGDDEIVDIQDGSCTLQITLSEQGSLSRKTEIRHEGQGVPRRDGSRIHRVDEPLVARGDAHAAHGGVESGSCGMEVTHTIY